MAVNDDIRNALESYGGSSINTRVYNYLGSLGYTGTISDSLAKYSYEDKKGWQALIAKYGDSAWTPAALFAQGQQGVWYEPKPQYLFQDAAGTIPVMADGDPVGLMLDLSQELELGPNLTDTFDLSTFALMSRVQNVTADSFEVADGETDGGVTGRMGVSGKRYTAVVHYTRLTPGDIALTVGSVSTGDEQVRETMATSGTITATRSADTVNTLFIRLYGAGASVRIDAIELQEVLGNHATQPVSADRPIYRTDGVRSWIQGNGVNQFLVVPDYIIGRGSYPGGTMLSAAIEYTGSGSFFNVLGSVDGTDRRYYIITGPGTSGNQMQLGVGSTFEATGYEFTKSRPFIAGMGWESGELVVREDGTEVVRRAASWGSEGGALHLFTVPNNVRNERFFNGRIYGMVIHDEFDSNAATNLTKTEQFLATRAGVTL